MTENDLGAVSKHAKNLGILRTIDEHNKTAAFAVELRSLRSKMIPRKPKWGQMNIRFRSLLLSVVLAVAEPFAFPQDQPAPPTEKVVVVFSQDIHYFEAGQGSAVILLHGLGGGKEAWMGSFGALAAQYHVYAIDQIGFGHSDKPLLDYKIATFADFLQGFMQAQNISKATLVGNSLGGWIALDFAARLTICTDGGWPAASVPGARDTGITGYGFCGFPRCDGLMLWR